MDELTLLRSTRDDSRAPSAAALTRGRDALAERIGGEMAVALFSHLGDNTRFRPAPTRRRTFAWAGFSMLGAAGLVAALVATDVLGVAEWNGGADPAAASALHSAALATMEVSDPAVGPGQYLFVRTDGAFGAVGTLEADAEKIRANNGNTVTEGDVSMIDGYHDELYVPADRDDDWVWIQCGRWPLQTFGPRSEAFASEQAVNFYPADSSVIRRFPGGIGPDGHSLAGYRTMTAARVDDDALPRDPAELLSKIHELNGTSGQSRDGQALEWITSALERGTAPAEFRAALYKAAALIPGVTITDQQATLNGTTGIAIGRFEPTNHVQYDIIIDPDTGRYIGEREVTLTAFASFPAGTTTSWTTVTTSVVDAAPTDIATCDE
ncbi:CU044_5270 family protein [Zhihengliuella sp. ISTPL4]|uniref:CU044_5270 family protein n=1 Tax=Zhihengliuella sp. ISTPL4 TaxID=2058657 RepID=UPI000C79C2CA|nr:CU044_5270 family protein [Zhihengliuella sp. ISTPL4]